MKNIITVLQNTSLLEMAGEALTLIGLFAVAWFAYMAI